MKCLVCLNRDSGDLYECGPCQLVTVRHLREIEDYAAIIAATLEPTRGTTGRMSPGYGSTPPANLDKLVALDPRSRRAQVDEDGEPYTSRPDDTAVWTRSILGTLTGLVEWIREERDEPRGLAATRTIVGECGYLRGITGWARTQQWVDTLATDIAELHQQTRGLASDRPPGPLGGCLTVTCNGTVYSIRLHGEQSKEDAGRCDECKRLYTGLDLVRLAQAEEVAG